MVILPDLVGKKVNNWFDLVRPLIAFKFQNVSFSFYVKLISLFLFKFDAPDNSVVQPSYDFSGKKYV